MSTAWAKGSTSAWRRMRRVILERDGYRCQLPVKGGTVSNGGQTCGAYATHVDHIVPRSQGGQHLDPSNLRAACAHCNLSRGAARTQQQRRTYTRWSW